jgi:hypothetical protein
MRQDRTGQCADARPRLDARNLERRGARFLRAGLGIALLGGLFALGASPVRAQGSTYGSGSNTVFDGMLKTIGLGKASDGPDIDYTERSPLAVPPTRDLPPPASDVPQPAANWPTGPAKRSSKTIDSKPAVVPETAVQTPNPQHEKKPWYNPAGWFDKEEYASFTGEPVRRNLTDPPAGYRIPSPEQPYGLGPEKKSPSKVTASDFGLGSIAPSGSQSGH